MTNFLTHLAVVFDQLENFNCPEHSKHIKKIFSLFVKWVCLCMLCVRILCMWLCLMIFHVYSSLWSGAFPCTATVPKFAGWVLGETWVVIVQTIGRDLSKKLLEVLWLHQCTKAENFCWPSFPRANLFHSEFPHCPVCTAATYCCFFAAAFMRHFHQVCWSFLSEKCTFRNSDESVGWWSYLSLWSPYNFTQWPRSQPGRPSYTVPLQMAGEWLRPYFSMSLSR